MPTDATAAGQPVPPAAAPVPAVTPVIEPPRRRRGPGGCVLGCVGLLLILVVTAGLGFFALLPYAREVTLDGVRDIAATEVMRIGTLPVLPSGELVLTEADVNRQIAANLDQIDGITAFGNPVFSIDPSGVTLVVESFGQETSYRAGVDVEGGRLVVTDATADGPAGRILPPDEIADFVEDLSGDLQDNSGVTFTGVTLRDGEMVFTTRPSGTPAAGRSTPPPTP